MQNTDWFVSSVNICMIQIHQKCMKSNKTKTKELCVVVMPSGVLHRLQGNLQMLGSRIVLFSIFTTKSS